MVRLPEPEPVDVAAPGHPPGRGVRGRRRHCGQQAGGPGGPPGGGPPGRDTGQRSVISLRGHHSPESTEPCAPASSTASTGTPRGCIIAAKNDYRPPGPGRPAPGSHPVPGATRRCAWAACGRTRGTVDAPIGRHPTDRKKMCSGWPENGRPAVTHWTVLERFPGYTHIQCRLETGRTHQIRVHHGLHRPPPAGGRGIRGQEARPRPGRASAFTPEGSPLSTPAPGSGSRWSAPCLPILPRC